MFLKVLILLESLFMPIFCVTMFQVERDHVVKVLDELLEVMEAEIYPDNLRNAAYEDSPVFQVNLESRSPDTVTL